MTADDRRTDTEQNILLSLAQDGPQSRAELARRFGVMRSTIGSGTNRLLKHGLVQPVATNDTERTAQGVGRPGETIELNPNYRHFIGVDIGVGHINKVLSDFQGQLLKTSLLSMEPSEQTPAHVVRLVAQQVRNMVNGDAVPVAGMAVALPGIVAEDGVALDLPRLGWRDVNVRDLLRTEIQCTYPISIDNDANVFARGGLIEDKDSFGTAVFLWLDAGIGAGIISDGQMLMGTTRRAGEIGHIFVHDSLDGGSARLDALVGKHGFVERYRKRGGTAYTVEGVLDAFQAGDEAARTTIQDTLDIWSEVLTSLTSMIDPSVFVIAGQMAATLDPIKKDLEAALSENMLLGTPAPRLVLRAPHPDMIAQYCVYTLQTEFLQSKAPTKH